ncbi:YIP1 family protein [Amaricoccus sp.]|uniref:YIP1 family protein n=1 Tax=Amaricoccus sp. TaxID=1872485 RepID=UPI002607F4D0|nr:YIP1 family protein [Amaricoccus sp.]HRO10153.1 hypothetical protein [Amaricoccus sp.]
MWGQLLIDSLIRPRAAGRRILGLQLSGQSLVEAAVLVSCVGTLVIHFAAEKVPELQGEFAGLTGSPLLATFLNVVQLGLMALAATWVGRRFGGTGELPGALALVIWYNFVAMLLVALLFGAYLIAPVIALPLGIAFIGWLVWAPVCFIAELHGFANPLVVLAGLVLTMLVLFFAVNFVAMLLIAAFGGIG